MWLYLVKKYETEQIFIPVQHCGNFYVLILDLYNYHHPKSQTDLL